MPEDKKSSSAKVTSKWSQGPDYNPREDPGPVRAEDKPKKK